MTSRPAGPSVGEPDEFAPGLDSDLESALLAGLQASPATPDDPFDEPDARAFVIDSDFGPAPADKAFRLHRHGCRR